MSSNEQDKLLDHNYDGIQELDNPLPGWWLITFYGTVIFAVIYYAYYQFGSGPTLQQELAEELKSYPALTAPAGGGDEKPEAFYAGLIADAARMKQGQEVFVGKCAACHGQKGEGLIGPNMTDDYYIHGDGSMASMAKVVRDGVLDKGMPPWGPVLKPDELESVVAYTRTLRGTNPPNAKAPQGELKQIQ